MIEFFAIKEIVKHYKKENFKSKERFEYNQEISNILDEHSTNNIDVIVFLIGLVVLLISLLTMRHAYLCSKNYSLFGRILNMIFGFFFTGLYMVTYFIKNGVMKNKC
jgi:positive regulator of sigma E activity